MLRDHELRLDKVAGTITVPTFLDICLSIFRL